MPLETPSSHTKHTAPSVLSTLSPPPPPLPRFYPTTPLLLPLLSSPLPWHWSRVCPHITFAARHPSPCERWRKPWVLHSLALFTQTKSHSVSVTKPAKSLWLFHVLSAHGSLLSLGHWPGPWIQWARGNGGRLKECASINLIMTWWLRSPW